MEESQKNKIIRFLANQLLNQITFEQVVNNIKQRALEQSSETFEKMSDAEKQSLIEKLTQSENL